MPSEVIYSIEPKLRQYIAENILFSKTYPYSDDDSLLENSVLDSMNVIELVMFLEEQLGVKVEDHEIIPDNFDSITRLAAYVHRKSSLTA
jgi:acyl carrier protein